MTHTEFARIARTLYGATYTADLAQALGIHIRNVQRYANGDREIPEWMPAELKKVANRRLREIGRLSILTGDASAQTIAEDA